MTAISNRLPKVPVVYDSRGRRATKTFDNAYVARRFYITKLNSGNHPTIQTGESK